MRVKFYNRMQNEFELDSVSSIQYDSVHNVYVVVYEDYESEEIIGTLLEVSNEN